MPSDTIKSDQLYNWSAHERVHSCIAPSAPSSGQTCGPNRAPDFPRLAHRALQALRQSRLQMSTGPGTWTQVLPLGQPGWRPTRDGLRPGGIFPAGLPLFAELPESPPGARADMQHQPRVVTASSEVLIGNAHGAFTLIPARCRLGWDPRRQFLAELVASRLGLEAPTQSNETCHELQNPDPPSPEDGLRLSAPIDDGSSLSSPSTPI